MDILWLIGGLESVYAHPENHFFTRFSGESAFTTPKSSQSNVPTAVDDNYTLLEDEALVVSADDGVLQNDIEDGSSLTASLVSGPAQGVLILNSDGSFSYTPEENVTGNQTFTYQAIDINGFASNTATVVLIINAVNDAPVFTGLPTQIFVDQRDIDQILDFDIEPGQAKNEENQRVTAVVSNDDPELIANQNLVYPLFLVGFQARLNFTLTGKAGTATFLLSAKDNGGTANGGVDSTGFYSMWIIQQTIPLAVKDTFEVFEDVPLTGDVRFNDIDEDTAPTALQVILIDSTVHGQLQVNADGTFTYIPDADFFGEDQFSYQIADDLDTSDVTTATIRVQPINDPPRFITLPDTIVLNQNAGISTIPVALSSGPTGETDQTIALSFQTTTLDFLSTFTITPSGGNQFQLNLEPSGRPGFSLLTLRAQDNGGVAFGGTDTLIRSVVLRIIQNVPDAVDDAFTLFEDQTLTLQDSTILDNDRDEDSNTLSALLVENVQHGTLQLNPNGTFIYTPEPDFMGADVFRYRVSDGENFSDTANVFLSVQPINDAPEFINFPTAFSVNRSEGFLRFEFPVSRGPDDERSQILNLTAESLNPELFTITVLTPIISDTIRVEVRLIGQSGIGQLSFRLQDSGGVANGGVDTASVFLPITVIQDVPLAVSDTFALQEDEVFVAPSSIIANDTDGNTAPEDLSVALVTNVLQGTLDLAAEGTFTYTPNPNTNGQDFFLYRVMDPEGNADTTSVILLISPVNDAPVAIDDSLLVLEDTPLLGGNVLSNDKDIDNPKNTLRVQLVTPPIHGAFSLEENGSLSYTPERNFNGLDSLLYEVIDSSDAVSEPALVRITVQPANDLPIAIADTFQVLEDELLEGNVLVNDQDIDGDSLSMVLMQNVQFGTIRWESNGDFAYTPGLNYNGQDSFVYQALDQTGSSALTTVIISILPVNDPPVGGADSYGTNEDRILTAGSVLNNDSDPDASDTLRARNVTVPAHGTLTFNPDGTFIYVPNSNFNGKDVFFYQTGDGTLESAPIQVEINVNPVQDAPRATEDLFIAYEDQLFEGGNVLSNDNDVDNETLSVILVRDVLHGTLS